MKVSYYGKIYKAKYYFFQHSEYWLNTEFDSDKLKYYKDILEDPEKYIRKSFDEFEDRIVVERDIDEYETIQNIKELVILGKKCNVINEHYDPTLNEVLVYTDYVINTINPSKEEKDKLIEEIKQFAQDNIDSHNALTKTKNKLFNFFGRK